MSESAEILLRGELVTAEAPAWALPSKPAEVTTVWISTDRVWKEMLTMAVALSARTIIFDANPVCAEGDTTDLDFASGS